MKAIVFFLSALLLVLLVFGNGGIPLDFYDTGPSTVAPYAPEVTIYMLANGSPDLRITEIVYHCEGSNSTATGAVTQRMIGFPCSGGECSNANIQWFYKYNPCFDFRSGSFSYEIDGKEVATTSVDFPQRGGYYDITIDSESGIVKSAKKYNRDYPCASAFIIPFIVLFALAFVRR